MAALTSLLASAALTISVSALDGPPASSDDTVTDGAAELGAALAMDAHALRSSVWSFALHATTTSHTVAPTHAAAAPNADADADADAVEGESSMIEEEEESVQLVPDKPLQTTLVRLGLGPIAIASAGVVGEQVGTIVGDAREWIAGHGNALAAADAALGELRATVDRAARRVRAGLANSGEIAALAADRAALQDALAARDALLADAFDDATAMLGATVRQRLSTMRSVPTVGAAIVEPYRLGEFAPEPAVGLRDALAAIAIADAAEETPPIEATSIHAAAVAIPDVGTAVAALTGALSSIEAAWHAATAIQE